ncbi:MAG TPA: glycosyltransferase [Acetobacteraceae bacterium]|nr:glycosyltransferase [Acetobacteraceae bacterium]
MDTEEEFDWDAPFDPASTSVENIQHQHLAQRVFDEHGIKPTYVMDYPVASTGAAASVIRSYFETGRCDVGAHLHPWVNPPEEEEVNARNSYACNLPTDLMRRKLEALTAEIERTIGHRPTVYKAGRYGVGRDTPAVLRSLGYHADTSVVPHTDFSADGGPDFRDLPDQPFLAADGLVEVPLSVHFVGTAASAGPLLYPWLKRASGLRAPGIATRLGLLERLRLSPEGHTLDEMIRQTRAALERGHQYHVLTYHSSSLMPGGSPYSRTIQDRDKLLARLTDYLRFFMRLPRATATTIGDLADSLLRGNAARHCFAARS